MKDSELPSPQSGRQLHEHKWNTQGWATYVALFSYSPSPAIEQDLDAETLLTCLQENSFAFMQKLSLLHVPQT